MSHRLGSWMTLLLLATLGACVETDDALPGEAEQPGTLDRDDRWAADRCGPSDCAPITCLDDKDCPDDMFCDLPPNMGPIQLPGACVDDCQPVACDLFCPFGYLQDGTGCEICECAPDPCAAFTDEKSCTDDGACLWYWSDQPCFEGDQCVDGWCVSPWPE